MSAARIRRKRSSVEIRPSKIAGLGAFAVRQIRKGSRVIEYVGERITPSEADARHEGGPAKHPIVLLFSVDDRVVIDAAVGGNEARFINHSCEPNCEAVTHGTRIWIHALRDIAVGEELTYDYNLIGDEDREERMKLYACHCGTGKCRGTMFRLE